MSLSKSINKNYEETLHFLMFWRWNKDELKEFVRLMGLVIISFMLGMWVQNIFRVI
jgi:hypothetical protein